MISAEHEQIRSGDGDNFADTVSLDFCDGERGLFGLVWTTRLPNAGRTRAGAVVFAGDELVEQVEVEDEDGISMAIAAPLEQWSAEVSGQAASLQLEAAAVSSAVELGGDLADSTGISQYEQLCRVTGTLTTGDRVLALSCPGRRVHSWGEFAWDAIDRWRTLYGASEGGRAISVAAALPLRRSDGHDDELRTAALIDETEARPFEEVLISTVWKENGLPAKAGLELGLPGDEIPRRMGGEAACSARAERDGHPVTLTFFRWSLEGVSACGLYEVAERR